MTQPGTQNSLVKPTIRYSSPTGKGPSEKDLNHGHLVSGYFTLWEPEGETPSDHPTLRATARSGVKSVMSVIVGGQLGAEV
jgi:hypothetical protein